jgi:hypothetical protein
MKHETWKHEVVWKHETWKHMKHEDETYEAMETWNMKHGTWKHGNMKHET